MNPPLVWTAAVVAANVVMSTPAYVHAQRVVASEPISTVERRPVGETMARQISLRLDRVSLKQAIDAIAVQARVRVQYKEAMLASVVTPVSVRVANAPLGAVFDQILEGTHLRAVSSIPDVVTIKAADDPGSQAQQGGVIVGRVVHSGTKQPIPGATILLDAATKGVVADENGAFRLSASAGAHTLHVRAVGYTRNATRVTVTIEQVLTVELTVSPSENVLDEVVVTGSVVATERKAITTPITVITAEEIEKRGITRVEQFFRGEVPGVLALEKGSQVYISGNPGGTGTTFGAMQTAEVYARGSSNLSAAGTPNPLKTYIDGVEILDPKYLGTIDPKSIERIEIITGPQAATVYGSGAMGGVMQIFTKKGAGRSTPDMTVTLRYGMLENNISNGRTPTHNHGITVAGGMGPQFTYSGNASYGYSGQWQPALFAQTIGGSIGVSHVRDQLSVSGSVSTTSGRNGTATERGTILQTDLRRSGVWAVNNTAYFFSQRISTSTSQTASLNADYRVTPIWQHHLTVGKTQTNFALVPERPKIAYPYDTLYAAASSNGARTTLGYNTTVTPSAGWLSSTLTLGVTGSRGEETQISGCTPTKESTSYITCVQGWAGGMSVTRSLDAESWGGFGTARIGLFDRIYLTMGLRGERNPAYGREHKIDWTPTNGLAITMEHGDLTLKLLGSYGRATRAPVPSMRLMVLTQTAFYTPQSYVSQLEAPLLTPEYSRGPQGGIELYYGNVGSLTVNRYVQTITDLIQNVAVDSFIHTSISNPSFTLWTPQYQYQNVAKVRQQGWESTASLNLWRLNLRGTYSWNDSRVVSLNRKASGATLFYPGMMFLRTPTHSANISASYALGGTSLTLVSNWVGQSIQDRGDASMYQYRESARLQMYLDRNQIGYAYWTKPGYMKTDLAASQRLTSWASATLNVINLGNSYGTDVSPWDPTLGRQTSVGVSLRFPRTR